MADQETYEGWANRETWALWLHVSNDDRLYNDVREFAADALAHLAYTDRELGEAVVLFAQEEAMSADMMREVGSFWRIDHAEIGAAARELAADQ